MRPIPAKFLKGARRIKLLLLDVDGVMTDGGIVMNHQGQEIKRFDVRDGHGIRLLITAGLQVGLVTGRSSRVVSHRARDLGIRMIYQNAHDKLRTYQEIKKKTGLSDTQIAYFGDDIVDLPVLRRVGLAIAVKDSEENVKKWAHYVTKQRGGYGAVREVVELLLRAQGRWESLIKKYFE